MGIYYDWKEVLLALVFGFIAGMFFMLGYIDYTQTNIYTPIHNVSVGLGWNGRVLLDFNRSNIQIKDRFINSCTGSMRPTFSCHAIQIIEMFPGDIEIGDIVVYKYGNYTVEHRVIDKKGEDCYITKGDANFITDGCVKRGDIIGKVLALVY